MRRIFLLLLALAAPVGAEEQLATLRVLDCGQKLCTVVADDLSGLLVSNEGLAERARKAEEELAKLKVIKGCAKLDVTEPSKAPPLKRDRDS